VARAKLRTLATASRGRLEPGLRVDDEGRQAVPNYQGCRASEYPTITLRVPLPGRAALVVIRSCGFICYNDHPPLVRPRGKVGGKEGQSDHPWSELDIPGVAAIKSVSKPSWDFSAFSAAAPISAPSPGSINNVSSAKTHHWTVR